MARDPKFKQALQCIRCGSCLNVCPVFRLVGGHVFGSVYTGGIGTILTAWFDELKKSDDIQGLCIQCGNCKEVCPGKLDIPEIDSGTTAAAGGTRGSRSSRRHLRRGEQPELFHTMLRAASVAESLSAAANSSATCRSSSRT